MGANERFIQRANRIGRKALERVGEEIRLARVARGLSQAAVAAQAGMSRSKVGRIERVDYQSAPFRDLIVVAAVVDSRYRSAPTQSAPRIATERKRLSSSACTCVFIRPCAGGPKCRCLTRATCEPGMR